MNSSVRKNHFFISEKFLEIQNNLVISRFSPSVHEDIFEFVRIPEDGAVFRVNTFKFKGMSLHSYLNQFFSSNSPYSRGLFLISGKFPYFRGLFVISGKFPYFRGLFLISRTFPYFRGLVLLSRTFPYFRGLLVISGKFPYFRGLFLIWGKSPFFPRIVPYRSG